MSVSSSVFQLGAYFAQLTEGDGCVPVTVGNNFWESEIADLPPGRLVSMLITGPAWSSWECHPEGEEFILKLDGSLALWLEQDGRIEERNLQAGEFIIVPRGVWHTAETTEPGKALFITPGKGTEISERRMGRAQRSPSLSSPKPTISCIKRRLVSTFRPEMTDYRRNRVPGGTYFFTVNLQDRRSELLVRHVDHLRTAVRAATLRAPFHIDAWVVLPEHMHCLWTLPEGDSDFSGRWSTIKTAFSRKIPLSECRSTSRIAKRERGIWQRRFWEHTIRDDRDYAAHMDYIHFNPVKHGLVTSAADWRYSSFHRAVAKGFYPSGWEGRETDLASAGEAQGGF